MYNNMTPSQPGTFPYGYGQLGRQMGLLPTQFGGNTMPHLSGQMPNLPVTYPNANMLPTMPAPQQMEEDDRYLGVRTLPNHNFQYPQNNVGMNMFNNTQQQPPQMTGNGGMMFGRRS